MKGVKKCFGLLLLCFIIFGVSLSVSSDVEAFTFGTVSTMPVNGINAYGDKGGTSTYFEQYVPTLNSEYKVDVSPSSGVETGSSITRIDLDLYNRSVPAGSLFTLNFRFQGLKTNLLEWTGQNYIILDKYCVEVGQDDYNCTLWAYNSSSLSSIITLYGKWYFDYGFGYINTPVQFNYVGMLSESGGGSSGLTQQDKDFLQQQIAMVRGLVGTSNGLIQTTNDQLNALRILIANQGDSQQETLENIQEAIESQNERDEQDRENLENQQDDISDDSSASASEATSTGTTLLGAFSAFVTALTTASPTNCNIDMDLGNLDLGVVNFCQLTPPQPIPTIASIFLILFFVPLSIATARKVINLFRSFQ